MTRTRRIKLLRAWVFYWIVKAIGTAAQVFPRTRRRTQIVNFLTMPFAGPAFFWAFRKNKNVKLEAENG